MTIETHVSPRAWELTLDCDWITALYMAALLIACVATLVHEIFAILHGHPSGYSSFENGFFGTFTKVCFVVTALYLFMLAFRVTKKSVKFASVLMGLDLVCGVVLSYVRISSIAKYRTAIVGTCLRQVALAIFAIVIAKWFGSVLVRDRASEPQGGDR